MGRKPCEFCGGEADTYGVYKSCSKCRNKALKLYKRRIVARKRKRAFGASRTFKFENKSS